MGHHQHSGGGCKRTAAVLRVASVAGLVWQARVPEQQQHHHRAGGGVRAQAETREELPSVEEALAGAKLYSGPDILEPTELHPKDLPMLEEFTCENFTMHYEEGGHAPWILAEETVVAFSETASPPGENVALDHVYWAHASNRRGDWKVDSSYQLLDEKWDLPWGQVVSVLPKTEFDDDFEDEEDDRELPDAGAATAFLESDPLFKLATSHSVYRVKWNMDPYVNIHVPSEGAAPYFCRRFFKDGGSKKNNAPEDDGRRTSFLRKTKRLMRHGWIRPLNEPDTVVGEIFVGFFESREKAALWARADPFAEFFDGDARFLRFNDMDVTGTQRTLPPPLNTLPDPILARLVQDGLVRLETRVVERIQPDFDGADGEYKILNITTNDPRLLSNVIDVAKLDPMRSGRHPVGSGDDDDDDDDDDVRDIGPTLDAALDLYPTDVDPDDDA